MMLSQNLIFVIVFTVHFHVTTWAQSGRLVGGEVSTTEATKAFRTLGIFLLISVSNTSCLPQTFALQPIQEPKYFPQIAAAVLMLAAAQYVPMKRQNLSKTLKVAKKICFKS